MYSLTRLMSYPRFLTEQLPVLVASLLIAEFWYKFHSFTLECVAFLATWFVLDFISDQIRRRLITPKKE
jgi:hypothetical protein